MRRLVLLFTSLTFSAVLAMACTGMEPGEAVPTATGQAGPSSLVTEDQFPAYGAPPADPALDITHFLAHPCDAVTEQQKAAFVGSDAEATANVSGGTGPECVWGPPDQSRARFAVAFPRIDDRGLTTLYRNRATAAFFEEMPLAAGYPVVAYGVTDNRGEGECTVRVGVSDRDTVDITLYLSDNKVGQLDPCEAAHEVATAVVGNIKARN
ncbi:DUF3558 domain-containing protein [Prauserella muralis]|uniref:Uncharacterized protein n=1 Tax=Prauserella muralis TaxID=588067 RepID=A0A2V4B9G3_9PSEU|nr:DUF3558 domain-containing protein [Prauserella muralis]PXY32065.1 hypothetical protein BAY60_07080 [Prauserella muralis]TWE13486.1 uncharacterized protein DUF3558 [Prauserella muralis]